MKKEWFFDRFCGTQIVAYAEDGRLAELGVEREGGGDLLGNIYKGRVANIVDLREHPEFDLDKYYMQLNEGGAK